MADTREVFEIAFKLTQRQAWRTTDGSGYKNPDIQAKWEGWQARERITAAPVQTPEQMARMVETAPAQHDREADRQRYPDPEFNRWLDESVSDYHTVWDVVQDIGAAWAGWDNRQFYAAAAPAKSPLQSLIDTAPKSGNGPRRGDSWDTIA